MRTDNRQPMGPGDGDNPFVSRMTYIRQHVDAAHTSSMVYQGRHQITPKRTEWGQPTLSVAYSTYTGRHSVHSGGARDETVFRVAVGAIELTKTLDKMIGQLLSCPHCDATGVFEGEPCACRMKAAAMRHQLPGWYRQVDRMLSE